MPETLNTRPFDLLSPLLDVLWADGRMSFAQVRAVDEVASLLGVTDVAARIARLTSEFDDALPPAPIRAVAYALAVWVAASDGRIHPDERRVLNHFERYWDLDADVAQRTRRLALGMARVGAGRPTRTQLEALMRAARQLATEHTRTAHGDPPSLVPSDPLSLSALHALHTLGATPGGARGASTAAGGAVCP